jgi:hypothetical protein
VNNEGWLTTERELNDRRAAMAAELQRVTAERDRLRALIDASQPTLASELLTCRERNAAIAGQSDRYRDERDELAVEAEELREAKAPDRLAKAIAALRADVAGLTVARDCLGKELSDARTAYGTLRNAFTMGAQTGWTARLSGTVLARCDAQAMREPGAEAEADPVAAEREQTAMCRHCLWDIVRDGGRWRVGLDADDPFACEGPADGHAPLAPDGGPPVTPEELAPLRAVLREHYLMQVTCDHEGKRDNPVCNCQRVNLGWHPSIGAAVDAWTDHVLAAAREALARAGGGQEAGDLAAQANSAEAWREDAEELRAIIAEMLTVFKPCMPLVTSWSMEARIGEHQWLDWRGRSGLGDDAESARTGLGDGYGR